MDQNYIPPMRTTQPSPAAGATTYTSALSSSPALYQSRTVPETAPDRRDSAVPSNSDSSYSQNFRRISTPYDPSSGSQYSMSSGQTIPSISGLTQSPLPSPHMTGGSNPSTMSSYSSSLSRLVRQAPLISRTALTFATDLPACMIQGSMHNHTEHNRHLNHTERVKASATHRLSSEAAASTKCWPNH